MGALVQMLSSAKGVQRVLLVALTLIPLLLVTISIVPALIILPFVPGGVDRAHKLVAQLIIWTRTILKGTSTAGPDRPRGRATSAGCLTGSAPRRGHGQRTPGS
jgi:hypothetical protein